MEVIHTDVIGPFSTSIGGYRYIITFIDEATRKGKIYFMKKKSVALNQLEEYKALVENQVKRNLAKVELTENARTTLLRIQTDGGGEYMSNKFEVFLKANGIEHYRTNADEPRQNGLSERYGGLLQETALSLLKHSKLPFCYWPYAFKTACYIMNCLPHTSLNGSSPHEQWSNEIPDISNLRTFGCDAWVRVINPHKGEDKVRLCTFLGYQDGLKGYIFLDKITRRIIRSGDAVFSKMTI